MLPLVVLARTSTADVKLRLISPEVASAWAFEDRPRPVTLPEDVFSSVGPVTLVTCTSPEVADAVTGPSTWSTVTLPDEVETSTADTPCRVMSPDELAPVTLAAAGSVTSYETEQLLPQRISSTSVLPL